MEGSKKQKKKHLLEDEENDENIFDDTAFVEPETIEEKSEDEEGKHYFYVSL
jgi:hypothetical protein